MTLGHVVFFTLVLVPLAAVSGLALHYVVQTIYDYFWERRR